MHASRPILALLTSVALLTAVPATSYAETTAPAPAAEPALPSITVTSVVSRMMQDHVLASGLVTPVEQVQVQPLIEGQPIEVLAADVGDTVAAGQILAQLSSVTLGLQKSQLMSSLASASAAIAQSEAQVLDADSAQAEAKRVADRTATLKSAGAASNATNDQAQAGLTSANVRATVAAQSLNAAKAQLTMVQTQIETIDLQLSRTSVVAPVAGIIVARNAQLGAIATAAGQPMFTIVRDGALELRADVAEADVIKVAKDQPANLTFVGGSAPLAGRVRLIEPTIDATTRLGRARIGFDDSTQIRSGMFVEADILVAQRETTAVPVTAVGSSGSETTIMKVTDGTVSRVVVTTGIREGAWVEILTGLAVGDTVVAKAGAFVADGDKINPVPAPAGTN